MALQDILEKIKKETEEHIAAINAEFDAKITKLQAESNERRMKIEMDMSKKVTVNINKVKSKTEMLANMEQKNALLSAKRKLLAETIEESITKLVESPDYTKYVAALLKKAATNFSEGKINYPAEKRSETMAAIQESGVNFELGEEVSHIKSGFILSGDQMESDNSFADIIKKQLLGKIETEAAKLLF